MEDIISQGDSRKPGGWRRRAVVAAALIAVVALVAVEHLPHGHPAAGHHSAAGSIRIKGQISFPVRLRVEGPADLPSGLVARSARWAAGARVPRAGARPDWYFPAKGRILPIGGLPGDRFGYAFTRVGGGWAIQPDPPGPAGCGDCTGPPRPVYYLGNNAPAATVVGSASQVVPAAKDGMWLASYSPGLDLSGTSGTAQLYSAAGARLGPQVRLPAGYELVQGTSRGLLLVSASLRQAGQADRLWEPGSGKFTRDFTGVLAVSAGEVAVTPPCEATCSVRVVDLSNGHAQVFSLPLGDTVTVATFSLDSRFLALGVSFGDGGYETRLEVASILTGQLTSVPHTSVSSDALAGFGWPGNRDDLVAELSFATGVQMAFWDPATAILAVTDVMTDRDPAALIVG